MRWGCTSADTSNIDEKLGQARVGVLQGKWLVVTKPDAGRLKRAAIASARVSRIASVQYSKNLSIGTAAARTHLSSSAN
jgi:hypothetical protein